MLRNVVFVVITAILIVVGATLIYAQVQSYVLQRSVIGSTSADAMQGESYNLNAITGQPVVGRSSGTSYKIVSGYLNPAQAIQIYLPLVLR